MVGGGDRKEPYFGVTCLQVRYISSLTFSYLVDFLKSDNSENLAIRFCDDIDEVFHSATITVSRLLVMRILN